MIRIWTIRHVEAGHLHGRGDFHPDAPFFSNRTAAEADLVHYGCGFEIVELRSVVPSVLGDRDPYA